MSGALERRVIERDHPALAGGQLLVGVEAERRRVPARAHAHPVGVDGAERLTRVLDDRQAKALERRQVGRVAEDVDRQQRRRALGHRRGRGLRIEVQRPRVDVGEHRPCALEEHHVGAGHERERRGHHVVARRHADRAQREVQARSAARHRAGVRRADPLRELPLERRHPRPEREVARAQDLDHRRLLLRPEDGPRERDDVGRDGGHAASVGLAETPRPRLRPGCSA
jgi:hypothetical protein